jgi:hypothetical protein
MKFTMTENNRFPAEWEKQQGYFTFPHNGKDGQENTRSYPMGICRIYKKNKSIRNRISCSVRWETKEK